MNKKPDKSLMANNYFRFKQFTVWDRWCSAGAIKSMARHNVSLRKRTRVIEKFLTIKGKRHEFTDDYMDLTREFYLKF